jgi:hypothetical protein
MANHLHTYHQQDKITFDGAEGITNNYFTISFGVIKIDYKEEI